jgi:hypothetical protein
LPIHFIHMCLSVYGSLCFYFLPPVLHLMSDAVGIKSIYSCFCSVDQYGQNHLSVIIYCYKKVCVENSTLCWDYTNVFVIWFPGISVRTQWWVATSVWHM